MKTLVHGNVFSISIPVDKNGLGPVPDEEAYKTVYQVWDQVCQTICECEKEDDAKGIADLINNSDWEFHLKKIPGKKETG